MTHAEAAIALTKEIEAVVDETRDLFTGTGEATMPGDETVRLSEVDAKLETVRRDIHLTGPMKVKVLRTMLLQELDRLEFAAEETTGMTANLKEIIDQAHELLTSTDGLLA